jgi:hypothetical protein
MMRPEGVNSGPFFHDVIETLFFGLRALAHEVTYKPNLVLAGAQNIVIAPHLTGPEVEFPEGTILYNLEQIGCGSPGAPIPPRLTARYPIWDYSAANIADWHAHGIDAELVPIGYRRELARVPAVIHPDIDVLFYGSLNERRLKILSELQRTTGLKVEVLQAFGAIRDRFISRAKVVLNLHFYETPRLFEAVRVSYLLANSKAVVSETSDDFPAALSGAVRNADYHQLVEACRELVSDTRARAELQARGHELFAALPESTILRIALQHLADKSTAACPEKSASA